MRSILRTSISLVLLLSILVVSCTSIFASNADEIIKEKPTMEKIQEEMEIEKQKTYADIYKQLEEQGATSHFQYYKDAVDDEIEFAIREKYDLNHVTTRASMEAKTAKYGATLAYNAQLNATVLKTYMDYDNSYYYILSTGSFVIKTVLEAILGAVPKWGTAFTALFSLRTIVNEMGKDSVKKAKGYALVMNVKSAMESSSILMGWNTYPKVPAVTNATGIKYKALPKHNPFN